MIHPCLGPRKYYLFLGVREGQNEAWGTQVVSISSHDSAMRVSLLSESLEQLEEEEDWKFLIPNEETVLQRGPLRIKSYRFSLPGLVRSHRSSYLFLDILKYSSRHLVNIC